MLRLADMATLNPKLIKVVWRLLPIAVLGVGLTYILWPARCIIRETPFKRRCIAHLMLIRSSLDWYREENGGRLPPPVVVGPNGQVHSWRVLHRECRRRGYRLEEASDSAHNRQVLEEFYKDRWHYCYWDKLASKDPNQEITSYVMLVRGKDPRCWDPNTLPRTAVLIVESAGCGIKFPEPRDLLYEDLWKGESPFGPGKLYAGHKYVHALRVDGAIVLIPQNLPKDKLRLVLDGIPVDGVEVSSPR
jgi:hypothetical protein